MSEFFDESEGRKPSRAQVRANRRNAKQSTGPRTAEGKRRSSMNAATHGVFCKNPVLPGERRSEYVAFRNLLLDSPGMKPQSWLELSLADQYVHAKWRIRGLGAAEAMTHDAIADDLAEVAAMRKADFFNLMEQREKYLAMRQTTGNSFEPDEGEEEADDARQDEQLERQQSLKQIFLKMHEEQRVPAAVTLMTSFTAPGDHHGAFERIDRLRHRLELSAHRALRELRQLRKDLGVDVSAVRLRFVACPPIDLASREIRRSVADGMSIRYMVPRSVEEYVRQHKLYTAELMDQRVAFGLEVLQLEIVGDRRLAAAEEVDEQQSENDERGHGHDDS